MNGAQVLIQRLQWQGVRHIFGYPGGCIMPLYDALPGAAVKHILCRHEQAAALAADGYARATGQVGVCVATSGPGATNLMTGVANAYMDSVPLLVITGQVPTGLIGSDAFQEVDVLGMSLGVVKHSYLVEDAQALPHILDKAMTLAISGRPGPVWVDIPKDVLLAPVDAAAYLPKDAALLKDAARQTACLNSQILPAMEAKIEQAAHWIQRAEKPLLYTGGGLVSAAALAALRDFSYVTAMPQVVTLNGIGNPAPEDALNLGMLGMHGSQAANMAVHECDLLLAVGVRFDDRATGDVSGFAANAKIIHLDIDAAEIDKNKKTHCSIAASASQSLPAIAKALKEPLSIRGWQARCQHLMRTKGYSKVPSTAESLSGPDFLSRLSAALPSATICCDVGQHQMWVAQFMRFAHPRQHLSSGGLGTMGYGLPAAIGAALAKPGEPVINVTGDGSFMMNLQELATIARYQLPVKIVILNNQVLGMVRQQQQLFYDGRYSEVDLSDNPEFSQVAAAFGIAAMSVHRAAQIPEALALLQQSPGAVLINVFISQHSNVWPIVKPGADNQQMIFQD